MPKPAFHPTAIPYAGSQDAATLRWYYKTPHWQRTRLEKLEANGQTCEKCGRAAKNVFHRHLGTLGRERNEDLIVLCNPCRTW